MYFYTFELFELHIHTSALACLLEKLWCICVTGFSKKSHCSHQISMFLSKPPSLLHDFMNSCEKQVFARIWWNGLKLNDIWKCDAEVDKFLLILLARPIAHAKNVCSKPKCTFDPDTTRNIALCSLLPK